MSVWPCYYQYTTHRYEREYIGSAAATQVNSTRYQIVFTGATHDTSTANCSTVQNISSSNCSLIVRVHTVAIDNSTSHHNVHMDAEVQHGSHLLQVI